MTAPDVNADVRASERLREVIAFLMGNAPLDGCWFGEAPPAGRTAYWWRTQLSESYRAAHADMAGDVRELVKAGNRSIVAFEALGKAFGVIATARARQECEAALVAQKAALAKFHPTHQEKP